MSEAKVTVDHEVAAVRLLKRSSLTHWRVSDQDLIAQALATADAPDGHVHWVAGGTPLWLGFFWWDRSGDKRGASNSGFYVQGFSHHELQAALDYACEQWPGVVKRQVYPLTLVDFRDPAVPGAVMGYPKLCDCGRGGCVPHVDGCAALTER